MLNYISYTIDYEIASQQLFGVKYRCWFLTLKNPDGVILILCENIENLH